MSATYPTEVMGPGGSGNLGGVVAIAAGEMGHSLAVKDDGSVWAWGNDADNELGTLSPGNCGTKKAPEPCSMVPVQVVGAGGSGFLGGTAAVAAGYGSGDAAATMATQAAPAGTQYNDAPYQGTTGGSVDTYTGAFSYTYDHTDLAIPGRGPSPTFVRSYNSNDTRTGALGIGWTHNYAMHLASPGDGTGDLIVVGPQGRSDRYTSGGGDTYTAPPAVYATLTKNGNGTYTVTQKDQTTWTFNGAGALIAIADRYGNRSVLTYNASGQLVAASDPAGRGSLSFGYNANGLLTSVTDWASPARSVQFGYDGSGRLQTYIDRNGKATTYAYDANSRLTTVTDANTHAQITNAYDGSGRVASQQDALGNLTTYSYGTGTTTVTYPPTSYQPAFHPTVADTYDASGRLTQRVTKPSSTESYTETFAYDANFDLTSHTDARGATTAYCYDVDYSGAAIPGSAGNLTRVIAPAPAAGGDLLVTLTKYDANNPGLVTRIIPPRGNTGGSPDYSYATTMAYYGSGSQAGMLQSSTDADGNKTTYAYDAVGRKTSMVDPDGNAAGGTPSAHTWTWSYDNEDRTLTVGAPAPTTGGAALTTQYQYDPVGNRTVAIDANGQVTKSLYDARNSLSEVDQSPSAWTDPTATPSPKYATTYTYDNLGNLTRVTRAAGDSANERATDYLYDGAGHLRQEIEYPSWPATTPTLTRTYAYDGDGNETSLVSPLNQTTTFGYDAENRLTSVTYSDGKTPNVAYAYDADGNRTTMTDGTGTTSYAYDELDRPTSVTSPGSVAVGSRYDLDGHRVKLLYPDGTAVAAAYDKAGRQTGLSDWASRATSYAYFPDGNVQTVTNVDGVQPGYV